MLVGSESADMLVPASQVDGAELLDQHAHRLTGEMQDGLPYEVAR